MRAIALNDADGIDPTLRVKTEVGVLQGFWRGLRPVRAGDRIDVELDLPRARRWSELIDPVDGLAQGLPGRIEWRADDGEAIGVRLGSAVVQIEMLDPAPEDVVGVEMACVLDDLRLYPTGI